MGLKLGVAGTAAFVLAAVLAADFAAELLLAVWDFAVADQD